MAIEKLTEFAKTGQKDTDQLDLEVGFIVNRKPARQWFNWLFNTLTTKINEIIDADFMPKSDVVDNLITDDPTKPVSAKQAKLLKDQFQSLEDIIQYCPIPWVTNTPPPTHTILMGQAINPSENPKLYALYGANLPDARAMVLRGLDLGRGIDIGRTILSMQLDQNKSHEHGSLFGTGAYADRLITTGSPPSNIVSIPQARVSTTEVPAGQGRTSDFAMGPSGGTEVRVKSIAVMWIVKKG